MTVKLWGGRFDKPTDELVDAFGASISFDQRLWRQDIAGSIAHARMLGTTGIIDQSEADALIAGLGAVAGEIESGQLAFRVDLEDIHLNIEQRLTELLGPVAGKLHTARSRNDQVALDMRLWTRDAVGDCDAALRGLQAVLLALAEREIDTVLPGYTHLQRAQPLLLAHHCLAYVEMLDRDRGRLADLWRRADVSPLGSGALAGVPYPIDRQQVAAELGLSGVSANSIDAVSDRDYLVEYLAALSLVMMHLSRLAEEIILWSSAEFRFIELDDGYATGSSMMPQKKNPDVAELVRGKTGRVYGHLAGLLTTLKGLPLAYNKDMQEDKEAVFDAHDTVIPCLRVFAGMLETMHVRADVTREAASEASLLATDLADYLVGKGVPFRQAHDIVGKVVRRSLDRGLAFDRWELTELQAFSPAFAADVAGVTVEASLAARDVPGGTAPARVRAALAAARALIGPS